MQGWQPEEQGLSATEDSRWRIAAPGGAIFLGKRYGVVPAVTKAAAIAAIGKQQSCFAMFKSTLR